MSALGPGLALCPKCKVFEDKAKWKEYHEFCARCGAKLIHECPGCKRPFHSEGPHCAHCGHALVTG